MCLVYCSPQHHFPSPPSPMDQIAGSGGSVLQYPRHTPITSLIELVTALQRGDSGMKAVLISPDVRSMASHGLWSPAGCCWLLVSWSVDVHCDGVFNSAYQVGVCAARGHRILSVEFSVWRRTDSLLCTACGVQCTVACTLYTWAAE